jgi:hypothetical protein
MKRLLLGLLLLLVARAAWAADELASGRMADGTSVAYVLTTSGSQRPAYAVILMPGGRGIMSPHLDSNGKVAFQMGGNFLIRSRSLFAEGPFVAASTDATSTPDRILAIAADLQRRYPGVKVYVVGTSRSTEATMALARPLDGKVAGLVHSSSMNGIATFDPRNLRSRNLIVLNKNDACTVTKPSNGVASHRSYGTDLIEMEGGKSTGDDCEAYAYHGYNGIERQTVDKIKGWIMAGG